MGSGGLRSGKWRLREREVEVNAQEVGSGYLKSGKRGLRFREWEVEVGSNANANSN